MFKKIQPLSTEQVNVLEKLVVENQNSFVYYDMNKERCIVLPHGVDGIKDLAWHNAYEVCSENDKLIRKSYRKIGEKNYKLDKTFQKLSYDDIWALIRNVKTTWEAKTWNGCTYFSGGQVWHYEGDTYLSLSSSIDPDYILNRETDTWELIPCNWSEEVNMRFAPTRPVRHGNKMYRYRRCAAGGEKCFVFNKEEYLWEVVTDAPDLDFGERFSIPGYPTYFARGTSLYILNRETDMWDLWKETIWNESDDFVDGAVWCYRGDIYYSMGPEKQYKLNQDTGTWEAVTWNGYNEIYGGDLYSDGEFIYTTGSSIGENYVLEPETNTWVVKEWINASTSYFISRGYFWSDGENLYYSKGSEHYIII